MNPETIATLLEYFDLKTFFKNNSPLSLAVIFGAIFILCIAVHFIFQFGQKKLEAYVAAKNTTKADSGKSPIAKMDVPLFEKLVKDIKLLLYLGIIYGGLSRLVIGPVYDLVMKIIFTALGIWVGIEFFSAFVPFNIDLYLRRSGTTLQTSKSRSLMPIIKGLIWAIGLTFLLDNLGLHVSTIIAGLGIVGVAVGLAGQAILADFFSYLVILLDKPFTIGDFVVLSDGKAGEVVYMGPKTTHLRSLEDDLIICANSVMTKNLVVNQGSIKEREVIVEFGIAYNTPINVLNSLPEMVREIVESFPGCKFDRLCLLSFGNSNLQYQLLYFVGDPKEEIREFMNVRSQVNVAILAKFNKEGINMDYPTEHVLLTDLGEPQPASNKQG